MKRSYTSLITAATAAMLLSACVGNGDKFPSLAIRDAERVKGQFTPVSSQPATPIRPVASVEDLSGLVANAVQSHSEFLRARDSASTLVGRAAGQSIESNTRQRALIALADLTSIRSDTAIALAELDLLTAEAETSFAPRADVVAARDEVAGLIAEQTTALDALYQRLSQ